MFRSSCSDLHDLWVARVATLLVAAGGTISVLGFTALALRMTLA